MVTVDMTQLNAHQRPPDAFRALYKKYQKMTPVDLDQDVNILDFAREIEVDSHKDLKEIRIINSHSLTFSATTYDGSSNQLTASNSIIAYESERMPGLLYFLQECLMRF